MTPAQRIANDVEAFLRHPKWPAQVEKSYALRGWLLYPMILPNALYMGGEAFSAFNETTQLLRPLLHRAYGYDRAPSGIVQLALLSRKAHRNLVQHVDVQPFLVRWRRSNSSNNKPKIVIDDIAHALEYWRFPKDVALSLRALQTHFSLFALGI